MAKVVYFDEDSATDYLIITEGGRLESSSKNDQQYSAKSEVEVDAKATLKKPWILSLLGSFFDASVDAKLNVSGSAMGQKLLNKTISNTVLSDYLANAKEDPRSLFRRFELQPRHSVTDHPRKHRKTRPVVYL